MITPCIGMKYKKSKLHSAFVVLLLMCGILFSGYLLAQCPSTNMATVGDIQGYHLTSSEAEGAGNFFWTVTSGGTIQGDRTQRDVTIKWDNAGTSNVIITYYKLSVQYTKCWTVKIFPPLSGGTISSSVTSVAQDEMLSYAQLLNSTPASGGIYADMPDPYDYQWEESKDNISWTPIAGATNPDGTGSNIITAKTYFRRKVASGGREVYSNVLTINVVPFFTGGRISASQKITTGATPAQLTSISAPSGGTGTFSYQWESSPDETTWSSISGATGVSYQPAALSKTTYYRRKVTSGTQWSYSNTLQVLVVNSSAMIKPVAGAPASSATKETIPAYTDLDPDALAAVTSYKVYKPGVTDATTVPGLTTSTDFAKSIVYLDGLARPVQDIYYKGNVLGKDITKVNVYDQYGRETVQHLPYVAPTDVTNAGKFRTDAATQQPQFFNTLTGNQDDYYYSVTTPEQSPLSRTKSVYPAGKSYAGSSIGARSVVRLNYDYDNVRVWSIGTSVTDMPYSNGTYSSGTLTVNVVTNAEGGKVYEFTDKDGKVVMSSVSLDTDKEGEGARTYYVYDEIANLRYIITPLALKYCISSGTWNFASSSTATNVLKHLCYKYIYDERGRPIIKEIPGADGPVYMVYDTRDRLVFAQNPALRDRNLGEWILYFYDGLDRPVMTALYKNTAATRESLQANLNIERASSGISFTNPPIADLYVDESTPASTKYEATNSITFLPGFESPPGFEFTVEVNPNAVGTVESITVSNPSPDISGYEPLIITYYDNYDWTGAKKFSTIYTVNAGSNLYATPVVPVSSPLGRITGTKRKISGKNQWLNTTSFYDDNGREIQILSDNISGGTDIVTNQYDFSGKTLSVYWAHKNPKSVANPEVRQQLRYEYTNSWLSQVYHTLFNGSSAQTKLLSEITYDEAGRIKTRKFGTLETLNYDYNLQGQLRGINAEYARDKNTNHYFGMELFYDYGFTTPRLDGNPSGVTWRRKGNPDEWHAYGYGFDNATRLTKADYTQNTGGNWTNDVADYKVSVPAYDENGNIRQMKQDGMLLGNVKSPMDDLTYYYENSNYSNRLDGVTDLAGDKQQGDFKNYSGRSGTDDYVYDLNGNLVKDKNRGITIIYNPLLNKPEKISIDSDPNKYVAFVYDAAGEKLQRIVKDGSTTTTYTYINGFIYKNDVLMLFPHPEGRIRRNSNGQLIYDYFITDNLGNTRTVITEETNQAYYKATHEDNPQPAPVIPERDMFTFPKNVDVIPTTHKFYDYSGTNRKFVKLNNNDPDRKIGTAKVLRVMAGDVVEMGVMSYYPVNTADNNTPNQPADLIVNQLINLLLGPATVIPNGKNNILQSNSNGLILNKDDFNAYVTNTQNANPPSSVPKAYLNYVLFDDNFKMVTGGVKRVSQPDVITPLTSSMSVSKNGYLYVYVSNESPTDVYFDDLAVKHTTGHLLQEDSYYPFGLQIRALSSIALNRMQNDYLYNGIEKVSDFDLEIYDALYRNLDAQIGRWWQVDPLAENFSGISPYNSNFNNPVSFSDPLGDMPGGPGDPPFDEYWWRKLPVKNGIVQLREIGATAQVLKRTTSEFSIRFVTDDFYKVAKIAMKARPIPMPRNSMIRDNLIPKDLKPLPQAQPKPPTVTVSEVKPASVGPASDCYGCKDIGWQKYHEKEMNRRMFETEQGSSYLIVKSAVEAATAEYATHKIVQGTYYLGVSFFGRQAVKESFSTAVTLDYRKTFFAAYPQLEGRVVVHHAVEQQVLGRFPGLFTESEMHGLQNLRGIPKNINSELHLSEIRKSWNQFYRTHPTATKQQILDHVAEIDRIYGSQFLPAK